MSRTRIIFLAALAMAAAIVLVRTRLLHLHGQFPPSADLTRVIDEVHCAGAPLEDVLAELSRKSNVRIDVDWGGLERIEVRRDTPVTLQISGRSLETILRQLLSQVTRPELEKASYRWSGNSITVTSIDDVLRRCELRMYDVGRIVERFGIPQEAQLSKSSAEYRERWNAVRLLMIGVQDEFEWQGRWFVRTSPELHRWIQPGLKKLERMEDASPQVRPIIGPVSLGQEPQVNTRYVWGRELITLVYDVLDFKDSQTPSAHGEMSIDELNGIPRAVPLHWGPTMIDGDDSIDTLIKTLKKEVDPDRWRDSGGQTGAMKELYGLLIVTQTTENQRTVQLVLHNLRRIRESVKRGEKPTNPPVDLLREP